MEPDNTPPEQAPSDDWALTVLVRLANLSEAAISLTVSVKGTIVTGTLIGASNYFKAQGQQLEQALGESAKAFVDFYDRQADEVRKEIEEEKRRSEEEDEPMATPRYLHMKDARFMMGIKPIPTDGGFLWRTRIEEVDGFFIGALGPQHGLL